MSEGLKEEVAVWYCMDVRASDLLTFALVDWDSVHRAGELDKFEVQKMMNSNVGILRLFPGITHETVSCIYIIVTKLHALL